MAKTSRNYGYKGTDRDEFGLLPEKEIINLHGFSVNSNAPSGVIASMLQDCVKMGETPTTVKYGGAKWNTKFIGMMCRGKYYSLSLEHDPSMEPNDMEMI